MTTAIDNRIGVSFEMVPGQHLTADFVTRVSRLIGNALWHEEVRRDRIGTAWTWSRAGNVIEVSAPIADCQPDDEAESRRYFGGQYQPLYERVMSPGGADDEAHQRLCRGYDARDAERDANLPRLQAIVREALADWKDEG